MANPIQTVGGLQWTAYTTDQRELIAAVDLDFTTYSAYVINGAGIFGTAQIAADGVVVDNLLGSAPLTVSIGVLQETIPQYSKDVIRLTSLRSQVTISGDGIKARANFYTGTYAGSDKAQNFYLAQLAAGLAVEVGFISLFAGDIANVPLGYIPCDGAAISRSLYQSLFTRIGTRYGPGDGSTTFNVPNLINRMPVGSGGLYAAGDSGGATDVTLTANQMPQHAHGINDPGHAHSINDPQHGHSVGGGNGVVQFGNGGLAVVGGSSFQNAALGADAAYTGISIRIAGTGIGVQNAGGGASHPNMPPYLGVLYVIKT